MKFVFATISSRLPAPYQEIIDDYCKKISFWYPTTLYLLDTKNIDRENKDRKIQFESDKILEFLKEDDFLLLFDERGKVFDSREFSKKIENTLMSGKKRLVFLIGGAFGVSESVRTRADLIVSFSKMVFNHHTALTVASEQVYRAVTIFKNIQYHND